MNWLEIVFLVVSILLSIGEYYLYSSDLWWHAPPKTDGRNWTPPR
ncbi:MAG: hypothetical protein ACM30E_09975 [Nitrososphaerales archaeon]